MPDLFYLVSKWWKQMLSIVILSLAIAGTIIFLMPSKYLSVATSLPASSYATDKASIFSNNIQSLYPAMGTPDDLDMIIGTAQLDTVYITMAGQFDLAHHYKISEQGEAAIRKAAHLLKTATKVTKSEYSELKVKVWDNDKTIAPQLANAIMSKLQTIHQDLQNSNNISLIKSLQAGKEKLRASIDSINTYLNKTHESNSDAYVARRKIWMDQEQQYEKLINEYQLMVDNKPPVLIVVEKARISNWPDKPKRLQILIATFVLSLLFSLLMILVIEKSKTIKR